MRNRTANPLKHLIIKTALHYNPTFESYPERNTKPFSACVKIHKTFTVGNSDTQMVDVFYAQYSQAGICGTVASKKYSGGNILS